jgi:acyl-coenzyme A thioesterase PaaI-like protein
MSMARVRVAIRFRRCSTVAQEPRGGKGPKAAGAVRMTAVADDPLSVQEQLYPGLTCFGCGHANAAGLRLRSYPGDGVVTATFSPWPEHDNGGGFLNGGIISTLLDCHSAAAVAVEARARGWSPPPGTPFAYVTAGLDVRFLRPAPLAEPVELVGRITAAGEAEMTVDVELLWDGKPRATGVAIWKRWRPQGSAA